MDDTVILTTSYAFTRTRTVDSIVGVIATVTNTIATTTQTTTTTSATFTPMPSTTTLIETSQIYLDNSGHTIEFTMDIATALAKRATLAKPKALRKFNLADTIQIIRCNNLYDVVQLPPPATITQTIVGARPTIVFTTVTRTKSSTSLTTVTTDTVSTEVKTLTRMITAAAPIVTQTVVELYENMYQCPPDYTMTLLCPEWTGNAIDSSDPSYDSNFLDCSVFARDAYGGSCLYWRDDGSPYVSTLSLGTGNPSDDTTRSAIYGNEVGDDCPSWSDYTCSPSSGTSSISTPPMRKRTNKPSHVKTKMSPHIPGSRGSKYVPSRHVVSTR